MKLSETLPRLRLGRVSSENRRGFGGQNYGLKMGSHDLVMSGPVAADSTRSRDGDDR
jgi:hypothetical protein